MIQYDLGFTFRDSEQEAEGLALMHAFLEQLQQSGRLLSFRLLRRRGGKDKDLPFLARIEFRDAAEFSATFARQAAEGIHTGLHGQVMERVGEFRVEVWEDDSVAPTQHELPPSQSPSFVVQNGDLKVVQADLAKTEHREVTLRLLDLYSQDPMGDGQPLSDFTRREVIAGLEQHPTTLVFLAYRGEEPVGLAVCFRGYSTFAAQPLVNLSDYYVSPSCRGEGIGRLLLNAVEQRARELGCCRLTLEVQENNHRAQRVYFAAGFAQTVHVPEAGGALFLTKHL